MQRGMTVACLGLALAAPYAAVAADVKSHFGPADTESADIIVSAPVSRDLASALSGISVLTGADLARDLKLTIGDTLSHSPGVTSTSFGPNASRPVLRGFQGDRIRVLTDGIGSFDVSNTSADHAVTINPLTATRIEVLRGPSALMYGSAAVGGVVNVIDARIPRTLPDAPRVAAIVGYGRAAEERSASTSVDVPLGSVFVAHVDGSYSKTGNLDTGGYLLAPALRAQAAASSDAAVRDLAGLRGALPNSGARSREVAGAIAAIGAQGSFGVSVTHHDSLYGVPPRFSLDPDGEMEVVRLDVRQTRIDSRGAWDIGGGFVDTLRFRGGYAKYGHNEIDDEGHVGTHFSNKGGEARIDLVQADRGGWSGMIGVQGFVRRLRVVGGEKFLPPSRTQQFGLFALQEFKTGRATVEIAARYEHSTQRASADEDLGNEAIRRKFDALSASAGASVELARGWKAGLNLSRSERAPSTEELFANGPHAGTQAYEIGDPRFATERSWGVEATLHGRGDGYAVDISLYQSWFDNYVYEDSLGVLRDGLPTFRNRQADARHRGFEIQGSLRLARIGDYAIVADGLADYVRADITGVGPVPRLPPLRLMAGLEVQGETANARIEIERAAKQARVSAFETPTEGYTLVNASLLLHPFARNRAVSLILSGNNLFDATARRHASFLKDYAPLGGRDIRLTVRFGL